MRSRNDGGNLGPYYFQGGSQEKVKKSVRETKRVQKRKCQVCGVYCVSHWIDGQWMWKHIVYMGHTAVVKGNASVND